MLSHSTGKQQPSMSTSVDDHITTVNSCRHNFKYIFNGKLISLIMLTLGMMGFIMISFWGVLFCLALSLVTVTYLKSLSARAFYIMRSPQLKQDEFIFRSKLLSVIFSDIGYKGNNFSLMHDGVIMASFDVNSRKKALIIKHFESFGIQVKPL